MKKSNQMQSIANAELIAAWEDLINEQEVIDKTGYSSESLRRMRKDGTIKNWSAIRGRKIQYSKTELAKVFNLKVVKTA